MRSLSVDDGIPESSQDTAEPEVAITDSISH